MTSIQYLKNIISPTYQLNIFQDFNIKHITFIYQLPIWGYSPATHLPREGYQVLGAMHVTTADPRRSGKLLEMQMYTTVTSTGHRLRVQFPFDKLSPFCSLWMVQVPVKMHVFLCDPKLWINRSNVCAVFYSGTANSIIAGKPCQWIISNKLCPICINSVS